MNKHVRNELANCDLREWLFGLSQCSSDYLITRQQGIDIVHQPFESRRVSFPSDLLSSCFCSPFSWVLNYSDGFSFERGEVFKTPSEENGAEI